MRLEQTNKEVEDPLQESRTISEPMLPCQSTTGKGRGTAPRVRKNKKKNKAQQKTRKTLHNLSKQESTPPPVWRLKKMM